MSPAMLTHEIDGPAAWRSDTVDDPASWYHALSRPLADELERRARDLARDPGAITAGRLSEADRASMAPELAPARDALETGRGFVIVERAPVERMSTAEAQAMYWLVGQLLGGPVTQNVQGTLLYDVRDTGQDVAQGARFSVTNYESSFHTDNSFGADITDYVGLLCLNTARSGGLSQNVSGYAAHNALLRDHRAELETLYQPFHVDRRGGTRPGEAATVLQPVIGWDGAELTYRYLRYWIEAGHQKAGIPLSAEQRRALDVLDEVLNRPELRVEFALEPGQMYFINNRWILHNRTAFEDHPEPDRRRHLVRLWLEAKAGDGRRA